jgi:hypothetical protein
MGRTASTVVGVDQPMHRVILDYKRQTFDEVEAELRRVIHGDGRRLPCTPVGLTPPAPRSSPVPPGSGAELYQEQLAARGLRVTIGTD